MYAIQLKSGRGVGAVGLAVQTIKILNVWLQTRHHLLKVAPARGFKWLYNLTWTYTAQIHAFR
jgi:hypothetical protein